MMLEAHASKISTKPLDCSIKFDESKKFRKYVATIKGPGVSLRALGTSEQDACSRLIADSQGFKLQMGRG